MVIEKNQMGVIQDKIEELGSFQLLENIEIRLSDTTYPPMDGSSNIWAKVINNMTFDVWCIIEKNTWHDVSHISTAVRNKVHDFLYKLRIS